MALCIVVRITLGHFLPAVFQSIGALEVAQVNLPVAVLIWLMIVPMLLLGLYRHEPRWRGKCLLRAGDSGPLQPITQ